VQTKLKASVVLVCSCLFPLSAASPQSPASTASVTTQPAVSSTLHEPAGLNTYSILVAKTTSKWRFGDEHGTFSQVLEHLADQLDAGLDRKGARRVEDLHGCCRISLDLIQMEARAAGLQRPFVQVKASIRVLDQSGTVLFSKVFEGESKTAMNTWPRLVNFAVERLAQNVIEDAQFLHALARRY
jgi:hypothetical protein